MFMTKNNIYKICTIMTTGRTGSDYLAGCLDGVKNIIVFSGKFNYQIFFKDHKQKIKKEILISKFIKENTKLFTYNKIENLRLNININNFKKKFIEISTNTLNRKEFFIRLYEAYHLTLNRKLLKSNVIVHHSHGRTNTSNFLKDFPNAKILITIRDPRANLKSGLLNWFKFDPERKHMMHVYMYLRRIRNDLNYALKKDNKKKFIKLEEMGSKKVKSGILKFLETKYDKKINISTFANKPWAGDKLSAFKKNPNGLFNKKIIYNGWREFFTKDEILMLNFLYSNYRKFYEIEQISFLKKNYLFFRVIFPFKFENLAINHQKFFSIKLINNLIFYIKRVVYIQLLILNIDTFDYEKKD
jgi:hypothetical protein